MGPDIQKRRLIIDLALFFVAGVISTIVFFKAPATGGTMLSAWLGMVGVYLRPPSSSRGTE